AYFWPNDPDLQLFGGRAWVEGVLELPVLTYRQLAFGTWQSYRLLTITASSWTETRILLERARQLGISPVVILTHPFEFVKGDRPGKGRTLPNPINQNRLRALCRYLAEHTDQF